MKTFLAGVLGGLLWMVPLPSVHGWQWQDLFRPKNTCPNATPAVCEQIKAEVAADKARWEARQRVKAAQRRRMAEKARAWSSGEPSWCTPEAYAKWYYPWSRVAPEVGPRFRRKCPQAYQAYLDGIDGYMFHKELYETGKGPSPDLWLDDEEMESRPPGG